MWNVAKHQRRDHDDDEEAGGGAAVVMEMAPPGSLGSSAPNISDGAPAAAAAAAAAGPPKDGKDILIEELQAKLKKQEKYNKKLNQNREQMVEMYETLLTETTRKYRIEKRKAKQNKARLDALKKSGLASPGAVGAVSMVPHSDSTESVGIAGADGVSGEDLAIDEDESEESDLEPPPDPYADIKRKYAEFEASQLDPLPDYMKDVYRNALLLNFQIIGWYRSERPYIAGFRLVFGLMFYSVPLTVMSLLTWIGLVNGENAAVLELLLVSFYTGPIVSRAIAEVQALRSFIPLKNVVIMQLDIGLIVLLYGASTGSGSEGDNSSTGQLIQLLTGVFLAIPSFVGFLYCMYKEYTVYCFGYIELYYDLPETLLVEDLTQELTLRQRLAILKADLQAQAELGMKGVKMVGKGASIVGKGLAKGATAVGSGVVKGATAVGSGVAGMRKSGSNTASEAGDDDRKTPSPPPPL